MSGRRATQSLKVPCRPGLSPWLRGTISYHAPARARGRSAIKGNNRDRVRSGRSWPASLRLGEHARALERVEGEIAAGLLLQFEILPPGGEFIGPGLDRID